MCIRDRAEGDALLARTNFPRAMVREQPGIQSRLMLPDPDDLHVLAIAIAGHADCIVTFNAQDFPRHVLAAEGLERRDPDGFLWQLWSDQPEAVAGVVARVHATAERMADQPIALKSLLKRAQLPKLAKACLLYTSSCV